MVVTTVEKPEVFVSLKAILFVVCAAISFSSFISPTQSYAAEWTLTPTIGLNETYTDNVRLAAKGTEQSAYVTQFSPGISLSAKGLNLKLLFNYAMQNTHYSGSNSETKTNHLLNSNANLTLAQNLFFLDGTASVTQQNQTPFGQVAENNFNLSDNYVEVRTISASPYFRRNFDNNFTGELRYSHDSVASKSTVNSFSNIDSVSDNILFSLNSGSAFQKINWGFSYSHQDIDYERQAPQKMEMTTASLGVLITPLFRLTSTAGYEKNSYISIGAKPAGSFWSAGFAWSPTQRTNVVFNTGHRFFGKTYAFTLSQRTRMSVWSLGYNENITTTRGQFLLPATNNTSAFLNQLWQTTIPDANTRQRVVDNFIKDSGLPSALGQPINTFTNQVFLQKSLQGSVAFTGVRNTVVVSLFNTQREAQTAGNLDALTTPGLLENVRQTGVNALWNWKLSPRTNASMSAAYSRANSLNTHILDTTKTFRASISRQLQAKSKATLEVRRVEKDSNSTSINGNFNENAITLYLLLGF
jgi:uncharacterized protein (PEP-CTERM system associated)